MATTREIPLPLLDTVCPETEEELIGILQDAGRRKIAVYPLGAGTGLSFGLPVTREGIGLSLSGMRRIVEYPARDMTITVQAGLEFQSLQETLASEQQWLPLDPPHAKSASVGGMVATNSGGPRRYGYGTPREYVIGIRAVDGRGVPFQAGGRVVKNVAGYDFCRLLSGSRGMLGVITSVTWKLRPRPKCCAIVLSRLPIGSCAESTFDRCNRSATSPVAIQWEIMNSGDEGTLGIAFEGSQADVDWQVDRLCAELQETGLRPHEIVRDPVSQDTWSRWQDFPVTGDAVVRFRAHVLPHAVVPMLQAIRQQLPDAEIMIQAGTGILDVRLNAYPSGGLTQAFTRNLTPLALRLGGHLTVTYHATGQELTHEMLWGGAAVPWQLIGDLQRQFDPFGILNPHRFIPS